MAVLHIYTQTIHRTTHYRHKTIHRTTQLTNWEECGPCLVFARCTLAFALQLRKKHGKPSVRVAGEYMSSVAESSFVYYCHDLTHTGLEGHPTFPTMYRHRSFFGHKPVGIWKVNVNDLLLPRLALRETSFLCATYTLTVIFLG